MPSPAQKLALSSGDYIAYHQTKGKPDQPGVLFLGGFMSDMNGTKATALEAFCQESNINYTRFDYFGHGESSGTFTEGTIGIWKKNVLTVLDQLCPQLQIIVGSSMGGWLMLLAALERPEKISALIGIAAAPDFTESLIWQQMSDDQKQEMQRRGVFTYDSEYDEDPYPISKLLIEEGRNHLLLNAPIPINIPVHLIHGSLDNDVPSEYSKILHDQLTSAKKSLTILKDGDHRMSTPEAISLLTDHIKKLIKND